MATGKNLTNNTLADSKTTNKLGTEPISKLLLHYGLPAIVGMTVMAFYNIIDRIFIGQGVGPDAISGLALTFPIMTLSTACGMLVGAGGAARISILLGKGDKTLACKVLGNCLIMILCIAGTYTMLYLKYLDEILRAFGGTDKTIPYAKDFLEVIIPFSILSNLSFGFNNMMRASGYPRKAMYTMVIGAVTNLILDTIFIFGFGLGIKGAAMATVISLSITAIWVMSHYLNPKHVVHFTKESFKLDPHVMLSIVSIGLSPFLINVTASGVNVFLNRSLLTYGGDLSIGAYGIINSFATVIVMLVIGLSQGMQPIIGYNYGAQHYDRVIEAYRKTVVMGTLITSTGFLIAVFVPQVVSVAFTTDKQLSDIATHGIRILMVAFPFVGFQIVTTTLFQSLGKASIAVILSLSRQMVLLLPLIWILPQYMGLNGVWTAGPIADILSSLLAAFLLYKQYTKFKIHTTQQMPNFQYRN